MNIKKYYRKYHSQKHMDVNGNVMYFQDTEQVKRGKYFQYTIHRPNRPKQQQQQ